MSDSIESDRTNDVFAALADPTRRALLDTLAKRPATPTELAAAFPVTRQAISKHLGVLRAAGLVDAEATGRERRYTFASAPLRPVTTWIGELEARWDARLSALVAMLDEDEQPR